MMVMMMMMMMMVMMMIQTSRSGQHRSTWRPGPTNVVQSDTEDYFRPSYASRDRSRAPPSVPQRWHSTTSYPRDDPYLSDSGLLSTRRTTGGRYAGTRTYDLESGRLFETKRSFFVSGLERPAARRGPDTKYVFSVSPVRSLPPDEFPTRAPPPAQTSPVLPPLRTDSSREAVLRGAKTGAGNASEEYLRLGLGCLIDTTLRSAGTNRLLVPPVRLSTVGNQAFTVAGPHVSNTLPEDIMTSQTLSAFCQRLKTWLFRKSYPDIII